jgi:PAS domain-containing protein
MAERPIAEQYDYDGDELLGALLESMVDAVYAVDQTGAVLFANRAALGMLGYDSEGELLGRNSHATIRFKPSARCCGPGRPARRSASSRTGSSAKTARSCRSRTRRRR